MEILCVEQDRDRLRQLQKDVEEIIPDAHILPEEERICSCGQRMHINSHPDIYITPAWIWLS